MKARCLSFIIVLFVLNACSYQAAVAQFSYGDHWYDNPLGFEPLKLHTSMGFIVPAVATAACLILTHNDTSLKQRLSVYSETGFSWGYKYPRTFLPQQNFGVDFKLRRWLSAGVELDGYFPRDAYNNVTGIAIRPFARFYPVHTSKFSLYFESGGGFVYLFDYFPKPTTQDNRNGTRFNGTTKYGIGTQIQINKQTWLMLGVRHLHISNGNTSGVERNPSHDSNGGFLGFTFVPR